MGKRRSGGTQSIEDKAAAALKEYRLTLQKRRETIRAVLDEPWVSKQFEVPEVAYEPLKEVVDATRLIRILPFATEAERFFCLSEKEGEKSRFLRLAVTLLNTFAYSDQVLAEALDAGVSSSFVWRLFAAGVNDGRDGQLLAEFHATERRAKGGRQRGKLREPEHREWLKDALKTHRESKNRCERIAGTIFNLYRYKVSGKIVRERLREYGLLEDA